MADVLLRGQMGSTLATFAWANRLDFGYFFAGRRGSILPTFTHVASTQVMDGPEGDVYASGKQLEK